MYHATKFGIEGFVEPGVARTEFRYGSAQVANLTSAYDDNPAYGFLAMLDPGNGQRATGNGQRATGNGLAPGDPVRMATRIIESVDIEPPPLRMILGSQALASTLETLRNRIADYEAQAKLAASTDFPPGE